MREGPGRQVSGRQMSRAPAETAAPSTEPVASDAASALDELGSADVGLTLAEFEPLATDNGVLAPRAELSQRLSDLEAPSPRLIEVAEDSTVQLSERGSLADPDTVFLAVVRGADGARKDEDDWHRSA